jgi:hypothetical protein
MLAGVHTFFGRAEHVAKSELFLPAQPLYRQTFTINSLSLGYIYDFTHLAQSRIGVGGLVTMYHYPSSLDATYGAGPVSTMLFLRVKL